MPQSSEGLIIAVVEDDPRIGELIHEEICKDLLRKSTQSRLG